MTRLWIALSVALAASALPARAGNRLVNSDFGSDLSGWDEAGAWSSADFAGELESGSLRLADTIASDTVLARQCVSPASPGSVFDASTRVRVAPGQSAGAVRFAVVFWDTIDCSAPTDNDAVGYNLSSAAPATGTWALLALTDLSAPALTQAVEMQLLVTLGGGGGSLEGFFDHVFLPEPGSVLSATWALVGLAALARAQRVRPGR